MEEITLPSFRVPLGKGRAVPGKPALVVGKQIGTSLYTWNRIHECLEHADTGQQQGQQQADSGLAIKVCWQPCGVALGMSLRALEHEWLMYHNIEVFCKKHPEFAQHFLHAHAAIFTSAASSTLGCLGLGWCRDAAAAEATRALTGSGSTPRVRQVTPQEAAATVYNTPHPNSITALLIDRAHGRTVQERLKDKAFTDISYVAELLLQLVPVLAVLQQELGFNHDDLRLANIIETWGQDAAGQQNRQDHAPAGQHDRGPKEPPAGRPAGSKGLAGTAYPAVLYGAAAAPAGASQAAAQQGMLYSTVGGRGAARMQAVPGRSQLLGRVDRP